MSTANESNGNFARAFLPGLVLGLIIGGVAGAMLPELMKPRPMAPTAEQIEQSHQNTNRDEAQPPAADKPASPADEPAEDPADEPAAVPATEPGG